MKGFKVKSEEVRMRSIKPKYVCKVIWGLTIASLLLLKSGQAQESSPEQQPISLAAALQEALNNNEQLHVARARIRGAEAVVAENQGALLPRLEANFTYIYQDIVPGFKQIILGNIEHDLNPYLVVKQSIYTGGKLQQQKKAAEAGLAVQELSLQGETLNLKLAVTLTYYQLLSIENQLRILQENRRQLEVQKQYARLLVQAGRMSELELNRLAVELSTFDGKLLKLRNDYWITSSDLSVLMGRNQPQIFKAADSLTVQPLTVDTLALVETALRNNPNWKRLEQEQRHREAQIKIQQASRLPQITAQAGFGYEFGLESFSFSKNDRYILGLNASMPIFDGKVTAAKVVQAQSNLDQVKWQRESFRKTLAAQVTNLYLRVKEMETQIAIQKQAVEQAQQSYRLALIEYYAGRRSNTDLLEIQKSLLNAELNLNDAKVNYNRSQAQLYYALGIL